MDELLSNQENESNVLRRQVDHLYLLRFSEMRDEIIQLRSSFEASLRASITIQSNQTQMLEKITAFNLKFLDHDVREQKDREILQEAIGEISKNLITHSDILGQHIEAISSLKMWDILLAGALGAMAAGGVAWIIHHLQTTIVR